MSDEFIPVIRTPELGPGDLREVEAHGRAMGVTNVGQTYYAFDARCPVDIWIRYARTVACAAQLAGRALRAPPASPGMGESSAMARDTLLGEAGRSDG